MGKFNGIVEYHDGLAVSEYMNMLPMGDTCLDRVGDKVKFLLGDPVQGKFRGCFKDSEDNIYIVSGRSLWVSKLNSDKTDYTAPVKMLCWYGNDFHIFQTLSDGQITFCESGIKPTVVFMCDGQYIYMWNTTSNPSGDITRDPFIVNMQVLPGMSVPGAETGTPRDGIVYPNVFDKFKNIHPDSYDVDADGISYAASVCWFDNKLVMRSSERNTVWISRTDPAYFFRSVDKCPTYQESGFPLWNSWYSSTNSADKLVDIASFKGQLYFINTHSIEVWGRTGQEDSPIQSNTTQVIHIGGRSPLIIQDTLFIICKDACGHEGIGMFTDGFAKISTPEIERRLGTPLDLQIITQRHENYLFVRQSESSGFLFREGRWSSWKPPREEPNPVACSIYGELAASIYGDILEFDENIRLTSNGKRIHRYIRDGFTQFQKRVIFRRIAITMDTGRYADDFLSQANKDADCNIEIYIALSTNRGLTFSQPHYRKLGQAGENNKVVEWRNVGSGNSILAEVGTSALHKLQIYDVEILAQ